MVLEPNCELVPEKLKWRVTSAVPVGLERIMT